MDPYQEMYRVLTGSVSKAIEILQEAQQKAEDIYINTPRPSLKAVRGENDISAIREERSTPL